MTSSQTPCRQVARAASTSDYSSLGVMDSADLRAATRDLARRASAVEADLLAHLAEIDERQLYRDWAYPSMFAFCLGELGFSEDVAYNRIAVLRAGRRWPAILEALRAGRIHVAGLRLLEPHLTDDNHRRIIAEAAGKSKREIAELVARLAPRPPVADAVRELVDRPGPQAVAANVGAAAAAERQLRRSVIEPLSEDTFRIQFTASLALRHKLREAGDLLSHRVPGRDLATIIERAVDLLIEKLKKERFAIVRKPRKELEEVSEASSSRHIPDPIKRAVFQRDGGRCTYTDENGRRCPETSRLEFDHIDGYARTRRHDVDRIRLLCGVHNRHAAEQIYGRRFMEGFSAANTRSSTRPGTGERGPPPDLT
jgi:hypothetical protein